MKTIKLLLIEDDMNLSYIIKSGLEDIIGNYEVCTATNGEEGLEYLKSYHPDVIVSDIEMPVMNGFEMVKKIRQIDTDIPVLLATGITNPKNVPAGYEAGADFYIKKPFTSEELDAHIKALINTKNNSRLKLKNAIHKMGQYYTFEPKIFTLTYNDSEKKEMTTRESQILEMLVTRKGEIVKKTDFLETFWEKQDPVFASRSLDVFISKLRNYLSKDPSISIKNIKMTGYIMDFD
jgi:DNA-binding response OmpR family regulator